jgi:hypothetical protein
MSILKLLEARLS